MPQIRFKFDKVKSGSIRLGRLSKRYKVNVQSGMTKAGQWLVGALVVNLKPSNKGLIGASPHKNLRSRDGILRASIKSGMSGLDGWVGTPLKYGAWNEYGAVIKVTKKMREKSLFQIAKGKYRRFAKGTEKIKIPARPWFWPVVEKSIPEIVKLLQAEIFTKPLRGRG